ncbi:CRISPR-associated endonuclease Cas2 [Enterococcus saccharolyticus]|uniref:CRISPR-associated endoribonuclease Cas2 n=1 Tax=Enterococcus saccharolyticus subsp. saccharolyticus ATCC 43076 TaxID=1139996 RepID=S0NYD1_9ENTE|nr:CRISPR-associated endonuclease Cas2 [Enterococcus saccharolyticus]EOT28169.1 CRISPR-associated endoribonuclease cas2 [Enterococcus saccharolyticus subsp. saccharolyticus ATCC 43076]EOT81523.1 CRISPR-associated endoribonuclease cas2 [Enterococcus saccharolyticus subsp. saccharolyticus ATCC 43076]
MYIILIYDISTEGSGARISRNVFKICKKYLTHVQKSVFEGELTQSKLKKLQIELSEFIRDDMDSVVVFNSTQRRWLKKDFWGMNEEEKTSTFF